MHTSRVSITGFPWVNAGFPRVNAGFPAVCAAFPHPNHYGETPLTHQVGRRIIKEGGADSYTDKCLLPDKALIPSLP